MAHWWLSGRSHAPTLINGALVDVDVPNGLYRAWEEASADREGRFGTFPCVREADSNPRPFALLEPGSLCPLSLQSAEGRTFESHSGRALELRVSWIMAAC